MMNQGRKVLRVTGAVLILAVGACGLASFLGLEESGRPFSHAKHGKEVDLECSACHTKAAKADEAGMPANLKKCMLCHEGLDEKRPPEQQLAALYPGEKPAWSNVTAMPDDVLFSHKAHLDKKVACTECHKGIEESGSITSQARVSKEACLSCHSERKVSNDCATCHKAIRQDWVPANHREGWTELHGLAARHGEAPPYENKCSLCHTQSTCVACHQDEPPKDHTNFWRIQGHGISAGVDRSRCATCHRTDFCDRCHQETAPRSHSGSWGSPQDRHCVSCHLPLATESNCTMCHKTTPSHALAAPKPADHTAGMNCRQCHGLNQPLPHPDKGDDCNACHQ